MAGVVAAKIKAKKQKEAEEEAKVSLCTIFKQQTINAKLKENQVSNCFKFDIKRRLTMSFML